MSMEEADELDAWTETDIRTFCSSHIAFDTGTVSEFNDTGKK